MQLCFFEDDKFDNFHPLTLTRPVDDLRMGIFTIAKKWELALQAQKTARILRPELKDVFASGDISSDSPCTWINSRYLPTDQIVEKINGLSVGQCLQYGQTVIAACVEGEQSENWLKNNAADFNSLFVLETSDFLSISRLWDLFQLNGQEIKRDVSLLPDTSSGGSSISEQAVLQNPQNIHIGNNVTIEPGCVLIAEKGPIYIGDNATVKAGSMLRGPLAICEDATINMGAKIYEDTTIGPVCKVGGEVNNTIFHSYSNKGHEGFVGNSVIGQWCNLGADTNTSNLKNNYSTIRITNWSDEEEIETGQQFFGTVMGDHSKTAINTQLNTGTVCGVSCNIFSADFPPKFIPSFSWVGSNVIQTYRLEKAYEAMEAMMARRSKKLSEAVKSMLELIYNQRH